MNEAARMVEEGVASPEDIDKAIRYGFRFRYAVMGLLEFVDWGGETVGSLSMPARYLEGRCTAIDYTAPDVIGATWSRAASACGTGAGFLGYSDLDVDAHREKRLAELVDLLRQFGLARPAVRDRD